MEFGLLIGGLALLIVGAELLVRGSVAVAERFDMSPLLIGLVLVGFGTSTPELFASLQAAHVGSPGIALGNIVGSNIANILLILGLSALLAPIAVSSQALRRDGVWVVATALLLLVLGLVAPLSRLVGVVFLALLGLYVWLAYREETAGAKTGHGAAFEKAEAYDELHDGPIHHQREAKSYSESMGAIAPFILALAGLATLIFGAKILIEAAVMIARKTGLSETVIGLTIVAVGTSLPELVTSMVAAARKHSDVALGNIMGSNIYNVLGIGGVTAILAPVEVPGPIARFDAPVMVATSLLLVLFAWTGWRIGRREGFALVASYIVYVIAIWPK